MSCTKILRRFSAVQTVRQTHTYVLRYCLLQPYRNPPVQEGFRPEVGDSDGIAEGLGAPHCEDNLPMGVVHGQDVGRGHGSVPRFAARERDHLHFPWRKTCRTRTKTRNIPSTKGDGDEKQKTKTKKNKKRKRKRQQKSKWKARKLTT